MEDEVPHCTKWDWICPRRLDSFSCNLEMKRSNLILFGLAIISFAAGNFLGAYLNPDSDGDGYSVSAIRFLPFGQQDCDDSNSEINPSAVDIPNNDIDEDCRDGDSHVDLTQIDSDRDGFYPSTGDCDDDNSSIHPDAVERDNDGVDSNCDGSDSTSSERELVLMNNVLTPSLPAPGT